MKTGQGAAAAYSSSTFLPQSWERLTPLFQKCSADPLQSIDELMWISPQVLEVKERPNLPGRSVCPPALKSC